MLPISFCWGCGAEGRFETHFCWRCTKARKDKITADGLGVPAYDENASCAGEGAL